MVSEVEQAIGFVKQCEDIPYQVAMKLQNTTKDHIERYRDDYWAFFYTVAALPNKSKYYGVLIPVTLKLMYPLITNCCQIANGRSRYKEKPYQVDGFVHLNDDLEQTIAIKLMETWLPEYIYEGKDNFSAYIINRFKREAFQLGDNEVSEYMQKKGFEPVVSYESMLEENDYNEDTFTCKRVCSSIDTSGVSAEDIFFAKEGLNHLQNTLDVVGIKANVKTNEIGEITKEDAKNFTMAKKLLGGIGESLLSKHILEKTGGDDYDNI